MGARHMSPLFEKFEQRTRRSQIGIGIIVLVAVAILAHYVVVLLQLSEARKEFALRSTAFEQEVADLDNQLAQLKTENEGLQNKIESEQRQSQEFVNQINELRGTVNELDKIRTLDPELLKKYSKVYFLNENYSPPNLRDIPEDYLADPKKEAQILWKVDTYLRELMRAAEEDDVELKIVSAYRSFDEQTTIKSGYKVIYGSGANTFSAEQGYSEHQLGTTVDFGAPSINNALIASFDKTAEFKWLEENAHRFGFVMSYPKGNAYYEYEPWHWRFVGEELARDLNRKDMSFYDLDQREIDSYLLGIFD
ncbi:MAG: hypothetical protein COU11_01255 [Candidatus Harrisonbacteria bacterium CG10_big_fil_rev_8_21_14_0_10_49_15]|uniref:D-alanyl-D-alanine carboxypeptidase-like core domain-containing protein n=1 Tax=Candidatus Harrisonbacteria bacterium CG10_big_fil_rev_8_21_14_0_10_49_15 TaxID=1974587 RepID=A0A2H0ULK1_9BACT|nr:MAG: hypothetical protein COU11_01255 [Candidatus Harrisonbacteria bacterium CG10_big_fil_rev_8_21_14_0_10_49_15]